MPEEEWRVVIPDHHTGYITWDRFLANGQRMAMNRTNREVLGGPAREGLCLLQGLLVCGHCGRRLTVRYTGNGGIYPMYECNWQHRDAVAHHARMTLPAKPLDGAIADRLLAAVTPLTIELALKALTSLEERDHTVGAQWRRRIERARVALKARLRRDEADLAERRYEAVDPANRLIASTLEQRWNDAMQRVIDLEAELASFQRQTLRTITADQKRQILELASDFPRLWTASTTAARDRKRMLRLLIKDITIEKGPQPKQLKMQIRWQGGATETIEVTLTPNRADAMRYRPEFVARITGLAKHHDDREMAAELNRLGQTSSTGKPFTASMISWIRYKHRIPAPSRPAGTYSVAEIGERYSVSPWVVYDCIEKGLVSASRVKPGRPYAITLTDETDRKLREWIANSPRIASSSHLPIQVTQGNPSPRIKTVANPPLLTSNLPYLDREFFPNPN